MAVKQATLRLKSARSRTDRDSTNQVSMKPGAVHSEF